MIENTNIYFLYFVLAILPGLIWMLFFLRKDNLPEPKMKILQVFYLGILMAIPAAAIELFLLMDFNHFLLVNLSIVPYFLVKNLIIIGLVEEFCKYIMVRFFIFKNSCLDEPIDLPIYMIISALGFATAENILLFAGHSFNMITETFGLAMIRFLGATLLHVVCSGIIGIFLALSFYRIKQRWFFIISGFTLGIAAHGLFDFFLESSIINLYQNNYFILSPILILVIFYGLLNFALAKIKKLKSVCVIKDIKQ